MSTAADRPPCTSQLAKILEAEEVSVRSGGGRGLIGRFACRG